MFQRNRVRIVAALSIGFAALLTALWVSTGSRHDTQAATQTLSDRSTVRSVTIRVDGMICQVCAGRVKSTLKAVQGVEDAEISLEKRTAVVRYEPGKVGSDQLTRAINELGYKAGVPAATESR